MSDVEIEIDDDQAQLFSLPHPEPMQIGDDYYVMVHVKAHWRKVKVKNMEQINGA